MSFTSKLANELHRKVITKFPKRKVVSHGVDKIWAADLIDLQKISKQNKHYKYLLSVIDIFSKYAFVKPLKNKTGDEVTKAFTEIFKTGRHPEKIWVDNGKEFYNKTLKSFLKLHNVELYSTQNEEKSCVVERFNRTLKEKMFKYFTAFNTTKYYDVLSDILLEYNNSFHNTIKMTPVEGSKKENEKDIYQRVFSFVECQDKPKFKVGDRVRITKYKKHFEKGFTSNWTTEIFVIDKVLYTNPITYKIKDLKGEEIIGSFYEKELQKSSF